MIRVGLGYDLHRLVEGRRLILGGVDLILKKAKMAIPMVTYFFTL